MKPVNVQPEDLQLLTMDQTASLLGGIRRDYCMELACQGVIPSIKVGKYRMVPLQALAAWQRTNMVQGGLA